MSMSFIAMWKPLPKSENSSSVFNRFLASSVNKQWWCKEVTECFFIRPSHPASQLVQITHTKTDGHCWWWWCWHWVYPILFQWYLYIPNTSNCPSIKTPTFPPAYRHPSAHGLLSPIHQDTTKISHFIERLHLLCKKTWPPRFTSKYIWILDNLVASIFSARYESAVGWEEECEYWKISGRHQWKLQSTRYGCSSRVNVSTFLSLWSTGSFSLAATPNFCLHLMTSKPRSLNATSLPNKCMCANDDFELAFF